KINQPRFQKDLTQKENPQLILREALGILELLKTAGVLTDSNRLRLHEAGARLNEYAVAQPSVYLTPVNAMRRIMDGLETGKAIQLNDINEVERSFQQILPAPGNLPSAGYSDI